MNYQVYKKYLEKYYDEKSQNNTYVVAYLSLFDGKLVQRIVYASSEHLAAITYLNVSSDEFSDMESVYSYCADTDSYISVIKLNNTLTE